MYMDGVSFLFVSFGVGVVGLFQDIFWVNGEFIILNNIIFSFIIFNVVELFGGSCVFVYLEL